MNGNNLLNQRHQECIATQAIINVGEGNIARVGGKGEKRRRRQPDASPIVHQLQQPWSTSTHHTAAYGVRVCRRRRLIRSLLFQTETEGKDQQPQGRQRRQHMLGRGWWRPLLSFRAIASRAN